MLIYTPISVGELGDKITILRIKENKISDHSKLSNVRNELTALESIWNDQGLFNKIDLSPLQEINNALWDIEDKIRVKESLQKFDEEFISLARSVYKLNDKRAELKKIINQQIGSELVEEKSYS